MTHAHSRAGPDPARAGLPTTPRRAGQVIVIPRDQALRSGDWKNRRHVLLNECEAATYGTLAYASRYATEHDVYGAPCHAYRKRPGSDAWSGFSASVFLYPARLVLAHGHELEPHIGSIARDLKKLRPELRTAWGLGSGTRVTAEQPESLRGVVVALAPSITKHIIATHAIVVTEHVYSTRQHHQVVVPVMPPAFEPDEHDVVASTAEAPWLTSIDAGWQEVVLATSLLLSVDHREGEIAGVTDHDVDPLLMRAIESQLEQRFRLA